MLAVLGLDMLAFSAEGHFESLCESCKKAPNRCCRIAHALAYRVLWHRC
jgi:hypothetical protein